VPPLDPNEDVCAIVETSTGAILALADAHNGREAAEIAVEHVTARLDAKGLETSGQIEASLIYEAGMAVQRAVGHPRARRPNSRTTLALARIWGDRAEWVSFGDSSVLVASARGSRRLDAPRSAYLGYWFSLTEVEALATSGVERLAAGESLLLTSDGLIDAFAAQGDSPLGLVTTVMREPAADATAVARRLIEVALLRGASDSVSVAVCRC
jgi:serine/threonine protein phosphatase PrpC